MSSLKTSLVLIALFLAVSTNTVKAQVPQMIPYTGTIDVNGTLFNGEGRFKFAIVDVNGNATFWSNDSSSVSGAEPVNFINLPVDEGIFTVNLGGTLMDAMNAATFSSGDTFLRVWFDDGSTGFEKLSPDRQLLSTPYAFRAEVADSLAGTDVVDSPQIKNDAITGAKIADGAVSSAKLDFNAATQEDVDGVRNALGTHEADPSIHHDKTTSLDWTSLTNIPPGFADGVDNVGGTGTVNDSDWKISDDGKDMSSLVPGNVGIGTTNPSGKLHVDGGTAVTDASGTDLTFQAESGGVPSSSGSTDGGDILLLPGTGNGSGGLSGKVGIGTPTAKANLKVDGTVTADAFVGNGALLTNLPVGTLGDSIDSAEIQNDAILNEDISGGAGITDDKLAPITTTGMVADTALSGNVSLLGQTIGGTEIEPSTITNDQIATGAFPKITGVGALTQLSIGGSLGIGTIAPIEKLEVIGRVKADFFIGDGSLLTNLKLANLAFDTATQAELDNHQSDASAHHIKTSTWAEIGGQIPDTKIPDGITRDAEVLTIVTWDTLSGIPLDFKDGVDNVGGGGTVNDSDWSISGNNMSSGVSGNVGIGTTTPTGKLHVDGGTAAADTSGRKLTFKAESGGPVSTGASSTSGGDILLLPGKGTGSSAIDGKVGIGTSAPTETLEVAGTVKASAFVGDGSLLSNLPDGVLGTSIETAEIANDAVTSAKIAPGTIVDADISDGTISDSKLAQIATSGKVADTALSSNVSLLGQTIESGEIADNNIINNDLKEGSFGKITGLGTLSSLNVAGAVGIGTPTVNANLTVEGTVTANAFSGNGAGLTNLPDGVLGNSIGAGEIEAGAIVDADISDGTISDSKLAQISTSGKVADTALSSNVSLLGQTIESSEIADNNIINNDLKEGSFGKITGLGTLSSLNVAGAVGIGTPAANANLKVDGTVTANAFFGDGAQLSNLPVGVLGTSIETAEIADDAVTSAKIAPGTIVNSDLSAGSFSKITGLGTLGSLKVAGAVGIGTPTVNANLKVDGTVTANAFFGDGAQLSNLPVGVLGTSIETAEIANDAVTSAKIAPGTIVDADISDGTISDSKLAQISTSGKVADTALSSNVSLLGQTIESGEIADNNIINKDLKAGSFGKITGLGILSSLNVTGNVGIGTTTPGAKLEIVGQIKIRTDNAEAGKVLTSDELGLASWQMPVTGGAGDGNSLDAADGFPIDVVIVDSIGNVGIGTNKPGYPFELNATTSGPVAHLGNNQQGGRVLQLRAAGQGAPPVLTLYTTNAIGKVSGSSIEFDGTIRGGARGNAARISGFITDMKAGNAGALTFETNSLGALIERMRITNNGNVGIGTRFPAGTLHVDGGTAASGNGLPIILQAQNDSGNNNNGNRGGDILLRPGSGIEVKGNVGIGQGTVSGFPNYDLDVVGTIGGNTFYDTTNFRCFAGACGSDRRLKENIIPIENALENISRLEPVKFEYKDELWGKGTQDGLIAQEVEAVYPEWVSEGDDGYKRINYGLQIQMQLIAAVKELKAQNEALKAELAEIRELLK